MPLPQKLIDRLSREPAGTPGWSGQLLLFSSALFLISVFVYVGIVFGYQPYFRGEQKKLDDKIQSFMQQVPLAEQENIVSFYAQLTNIRELLDRHTMLTPLFAWFEHNTQTNVYYQQFSLDAANGEAKFNGVGKTLADVEEQLAIFEQSKDLKAVSFGRISTGEKGGWSFDSALTFAPGFFTNGPSK